MEQIDLKHIIEQHPEVLTDHTKLKAYILDLYPNCKRGMVNILVAIQQCGIVAEMQASKNPAALDMSRWKKVLDDNYAFDAATAETCLQMWSNAVGIQVEIKINVEAKQDVILSPNKAISKENAPVSSELQNSQKHWFEFDGSVLKRIKEEYQQYHGELYIPMDTSCIGMSAFKDCVGLTSVIFSNNVTGIARQVFEGCISLKKVIIPKGLNVIGEASFSHCTNLTDIIVPDSVTEIYSFAFSGAGLTNFIIPKGIKQIRSCTFSSCTNLESITIPASVTYISDYVFSKSQKLSMINYPSTKSQWNAIEKKEGWDKNSGPYIIHCTDGDILPCLSEKSAEIISAHKSFAEKQNEEIYYR